MSLFQTPIDIGVAAKMLERAWLWWINELAALLPLAWRNKLFGSVDVLTLDVECGEMILRRFKGQRHEVLWRAQTTIDDRGEPALPAGIREGVERSRRFGAPLILRVPKGDVLFRTLRLPKMSVRELKQLLAYEIERQSPLALEAIHYDYCVGRRTEDADRIEVTLRIIRRDVVEQVRISSTTLLGEPDAVAIASEVAPALDEFFDFGRRRNLRVLARRHFVSFLLLAVFSLTAANLSTAYARRAAAIEEMDERIVQLGPDVKRAAALGEQILEAERRLAFGPEEKKQAPLVGILNDIASVLPDDSWAFEFDYRDGTVRLRGFTPDASRLLRIVDASEVFTDVEFRAPVMPSRNGELERFDLAFAPGEMAQ